MGCVCCSLSSFVSIVLDALERISMCTVCAMLTCCIVFTILIVLMMGIGIGYHYCFVQSSLHSMGGGQPSRRSGDSEAGVLRSVEKSVRGGLAHRVERRDIDNPPLTNNKTILFDKLYLTNHTVTKIMYNG